MSEDLDVQFPDMDAFNRRVSVYMVDGRINVAQMAQDLVALVKSGSHDKSLADLLELVAMCWASVVIYDMKRPN